MSTVRREEGRVVEICVALQVAVPSDKHQATSSLAPDANATEYTRLTVIAQRCSSVNVLTLGFQMNMHTRLEAGR